MLVLLAVTFLADAFYFIPRATLAGIIIVAMFSIMEVTIIKRLWRNSSKLHLTHILLVSKRWGVSDCLGELCTSPSLNLPPAFQK